MRKYTVLGIVAGILLFAATASAAPAPNAVAPVSIDAAGLAGLNSLRIPCNVNGYAVECAVDTGSSAGIYMGGNMVGTPHGTASMHGTPIACEGALTVTSVTGTASACKVRVRIIVGGRAVIENGILNDSYGWIPLIGLPTLRGLYPQGFAVDFQTRQIVPLGVVTSPTSSSR